MHTTNRRSTPSATSRGERVLTADMSSCRHLPDLILSLLGQPLPHRRSRRSIRANIRCRMALCGAYFSRRPALLTAPAKLSWEDRDMHFPSPRGSLAHWRACTFFYGHLQLPRCLQKDLPIVQVASLVAHRQSCTSVDSLLVRLSFPVSSTASSCSSRLC